MNLPNKQTQYEEITMETVQLMTEAAEKMTRNLRKNRGRPHTKGNPVPLTQRQLNRIRR